MTKQELTYNEYFKNVVQIGGGTYGDVFRCIDRVSNTRVVIKAMKTLDEHEGVGCAAIREISLLQQLHHPNIVEYKKVLHIQDKPVLVLEECDTDLREYMAQHDVLPIDQERLILRELLLAVNFLHENSVIHRDLKPENIFLQLKEKIAVKLGDFGLARIYGYEKNHTIKVVTLHYRAPEVLNETNIHTTAIDIWSIGCIWVEMATGQVLFQGRSEIDQLRAIEAGFRHHRHSFDPREFLLLELMLDSDPETRPTCQEVLDRLDDIWGPQ